MLITRLEIYNLRKIEEAKIDFHGPGAQAIEGINRSGKTTIAQAIAITMNGSKDFPPGMITNGKEEAEIIAYTDNELKIRTVMSKGVKQTAAQYDEVLQRHVNISGGVRTFLDSLCSGLEQPWALRDMPDADIVEMLMSRSGASEKIAEIDKTLAEKEQLRTETGRDRKKLGDPGKPPEEVKHPDPIDGIQAERKKAQEYLEWQQKQFNAAAEDLRKRCLFNSLEDIETFKEYVDVAISEMTQTLAVKQNYIGKINGYTQEDLDRLEKAFTQWVTAEQAAKAYDAYLEKKKQCDNLDKQYTALTAKIEELRVQRKKAIADMNLRVSGLEIGEDNMLYHNGVLRGITKTNKTGNWSTAESVQVFFGLGARFAGKMKVLVVDNAESLDAKTTGTITQWAEKAGFLVIMLRVAEIPEDLEEGIIYIREGEVFAK